MLIFCQVSQLRPHCTDFLCIHMWKGDWGVEEEEGREDGKLWTGDGISNKLPLQHAYFCPL